MSRQRIIAQRPKNNTAGSNTGSTSALDGLAFGIKTMKIFSLFLGGALGVLLAFLAALISSGTHVGNVAALAVLPIVKNAAWCAIISLIAIFMNSAARFLVQLDEINPPLIVRFISNASQVFMVVAVITVLHGVTTILFQAEHFYEVCQSALQQAVEKTYP